MLNQVLFCSQRFWCSSKLIWHVGSSSLTTVCHLISRYTGPRITYIPRSADLTEPDRIKELCCCWIVIHLFHLYYFLLILTMSPITESFVPVSKDSDFPIQNIPFGVFSTSEKVTMTVITMYDRVGIGYLCCLLCVSLSLVLVQLLETKCLISQRLPRLVFWTILKAWMSLPKSLAR